MKEYMIIKSKLIAELVQSVNQRLAEGWELVGPMQPTPRTEYQEREYYQTMIRDKHDKT